MKILNFWDRAPHEFVIVPISILDIFFFNSHWFFIISSFGTFFLSKPLYSWINPASLQKNNPFDWNGILLNPTDKVIDTIVDLDVIGKNYSKLELNGQIFINLAKVIFGYGNSYIFSNIICIH